MTKKKLQGRFNCLGGKLIKMVAGSDGFLFVVAVSMYLETHDFNFFSYNVIEVQING